MITVKLEFVSPELFIVQERVNLVEGSTTDELIA
jgi:hypothetical protein